MQAYITVGYHSRTHHCDSRGTFFAAAFQVYFEVYSASMSGTKVLEANVHHRLLKDRAIVCSTCRQLAQLSAAIIPQASLFRFRAGPRHMK